MILMSSLVCCLACTVLSADESAQSYLYQPAFCMDHELRLPAAHYVPEPGDIFLATGRERWAKVGHWLAGTGAPQHTGIIVRRWNGTLGLLEAGPHNCLHCAISDVLPQLLSYAEIERVWIRRRRIPLTPEQNSCLTSFAESVNGKRFALLRMLCQITPFRCRGLLLDYGFGKPHHERDSYFCAELVAEACVSCGLLDPLTTRPTAMYPRDFFFGHSKCSFINRCLCMDDWEPPARWTPCPGTEPCLKRWPYLDGDQS